MNRLCITLALVMTTLVISFHSVSAQVIIAPTAVFMDDGSKFASVMIINRSNESRDVALDFKFGYPQSDSLGNITVNYQDSATERKYSLVSWIKVFPRQFTLQPGEQRTVRLTVKTPADLPDGAYWGRMITTSSPKAQLIDTNATAIGAQLNFVFNQVVPVVFQHGKLESALSVERNSVVADTGRIDIISAIRCSGHTPFFGATSLRILDDKGSVVEEQKAPLAVYFNLAKRFTLDRKLYKAGKYKAEIAISGQRGDVEERFLRNITPVNITVPFSITATPKNR